MILNNKIIAVELLTGDWVFTSFTGTSGRLLERGKNISGQNPHFKTF